MGHFEFPVLPTSMLPLDLHIAILSHVSPAKSLLPDNIAIQTFVSYSQVNSLLREAVSVPALWSSHYHTRYQHCIPGNETFRKVQHRSNWRLMYYERHRMDKIALELLRDITISRCTRNEKALMLSKMGLDIWDVLDIVVASAPAIQSPPSVELPYALTRSFWANRMLGILAREEAINVWATLLATSDVPVKEKASFEQTMFGLSSFFGQSIQQLTGILDDLETDCRTYVQKETTLDAKSSEYNIPEICQSIVSFMITNGFGPSHTNSIMNHFPHAYLVTNKRTLAIALVHVFVSLARRLGLDASPINFPEKVLCHVKSHREGERPFHVNVFVDDAQRCMIRLEDMGLHLSDPRNLNIIQHLHLAQYFGPADPSVMVLRAARNVLVSYSNAANMSYDIAQGCLYLAMVAHLMFHDDIEGLAQIMRMVDLWPVDCATFLMGKLAPLLPVPSRFVLESHCKQTLEEEAVEAEMVQMRSGSQPVRYCIGLPFKHRRNGYVACIIRWDTVCRASDTWINQMRVDDLDRGRHQPFYTSLVLDEHGTQRYVAEENVEPTGLPEVFIERLLEKHPIMAMYFQGVEFEDSAKPNRRWRMMLSPESKSSYPEDDAMGSDWVREGVSRSRGIPSQTDASVCDIA